MFLFRLLSFMVIIIPLYTSIKSRDTANLASIVICGFISLIFCSFDEK